MADEPDAPIRRPIAGPKRKSRKTNSPHSMQISAAGRSLAKDLRDALTSMLDDDALIRALRRRGTTIDTKDYEQAYDDLVNPIPHPNRLHVIADLCNVMGGVFLGYAINVLTNDRPDYTRIGLAGLAGVFLCGVTVALKNLRLVR